MDRKRCPCEFPEIEPCGTHCSCAQPVQSGGCRRCASYGSYEQQIYTARHIVSIEADRDRLQDGYTTCEQCDTHTNGVQFCATCWNRAHLQIRELKAALEKYGNHLDSCGHGEVKRRYMGDPCTCNWPEAFDRDESNEKRNEVCMPPLHCPGCTCASSFTPDCSVHPNDSCTCGGKYTCKWCVDGISDGRPCGGDKS